MILSPNACFTRDVCYAYLSFGFRRAAMKLQGFVTLLGATVAQQQTCSNWRINWFHLQDESGSFYGHMARTREQLKEAGETIMSRYPGSRAGIGSFSDKGAWPEYQVLSPLGTMQSFSNNMDAYFTAADFWDIPTGPDWPETDAAAPPSTYANSVKWDEPEGVLEPIIYAAKRQSWDSGDNVLRLVTVAIAGLPHFKWDGSQEANIVRNYPDFHENVVPSHEGGQGAQHNYATLELTKQVMDAGNIHLVVMYGLDGNHETPR
eukprot:Gregarina_sp_Poly_1__10305@NODE_726_length_6582_cov_72_170837_g544_i0_p4_GENE_NODE_726_length_6582_cov_72_170837_g544_i0NODE_726_length_6582_cov_72_170837_g544_i0_p4_ORF_typecomplete_len262_score19_85Integrin_beta/PF00362_18/1_2e07_NODE_726_length_6582_cov_72_170837_g544_i017642549